MSAIDKEYVENGKGEIFETSQRSDGDGGWGRTLGERNLVNYRQTCMMQ